MARHEKKRRSARVRVDWTRNGDVLIAKVAGSIYSADFQDWKTKLDSGIGPEDRKLVVDFKDVRFLGSAGLRVLLLVARRFNRAKHRFAICRLNHLVGQVVEVSGFDTFLSVYDSVDAAVAAVDARHPPLSQLSLLVTDPEWARAPTGG